MNKSIPTYIKTTSILEAPLVHDWNDDWQESIYNESPRLVAKISKLSHRAAITLATGFAEWVAWRMSKHSDDTMLFDYIDAVRAAVVDWRYIEPDDNPEENLPSANWKGRVRGPMYTTACILGNAVDGAMRKEPSSPENVYLANIVEHLIPNVKQFRTWRNGVIDRLTKLYPVNIENTTGDPVPQEVLNLSFDFKPEISTELLAKYLDILDYEQNFYLRSPEQMKQAGFKGTPYKY